MRASSLLGDRDASKNTGKLHMVSGPSRSVFSGPRSGVDHFLNSLIKGRAGTAE